jgi:hypothetical protein
MLEFVANGNPHNLHTDAATLRHLLLDTARRVSTATGPERLWWRPPMAAFSPWRTQDLPWPMSRLLVRAATSTTSSPDGIYRMLGMWRSGFSSLMIILLAVAAWTYWNHPGFSAGAASVTQELESKINLATEATANQIREQMRLPVAIRHFLPVGILGVGRHRPAEVPAGPDAGAR